MMTAEKGEAIKEKGLKIDYCCFGIRPTIWLLRIELLVVLRMFPLYW